MAFRCFCGSTAEPKHARLATPHSCANPCSRPRSCGHGCPLACHPGPCLPCLGKFLVYRFADLVRVVNFICSDDSATLSLRKTNTKFQMFTVSSGFWQYRFVVRQGVRQETGMQNSSMPRCMSCWGLPALCGQRLCEMLLR